MPFESQYLSIGQGVACDTSALVVPAPPLALVFQC